MNRIKTQHLRLITHIGALFPLAWLLWDLFQGNLGFDPIREATFRTGKPALILLWLSLSCTPINIIFGYNKVLALRKPLGNYAFMYVAIHFLIFIGVDYGFNWTLLPEAIFEKPYALVGFSAFLILSALAATSNRWAIKQLKKRWKQLHRLVYLAGVLAALHYIWLVKQAYQEPVIYTTILVFLLAVRIPRIRKAIVSYRNQIRASRRRSMA